MTCWEFQDLWQQRFDRDLVPDQVAFDRHLAGCPECRTWHAAAVRLEEGLALLQPPAPPEALSKRIVGQVLAERRSQRRRQRRVLIGVGLAASVMIAAAIGYWRWPTTPTMPTSPETPMAKPEPRPEPLGPAAVEQQVAEAGSALWGIWNRAADQTIEPGRSLLPPKVPVPDWPAGTAWTGSLEAPLPSLNGASQGVSEFEPVVGLGRFVKYFEQDLPSLEPKPGQGL